MSEISDKDIVEAKYRYAKAFRMLEMGATGNAKAAILQGYDALGGDAEKLVDTEDNNE